MKSRLVTMLLAGIGLALVLLIAVQGTQSLRGAATVPIAADIAIPDDLNKTVFPAIFKSISEQNGELRLSGTSEPEAVITIRDHGENLRQIKANNDGNWNVTIAVAYKNIWALDLMAYVEGGGTIRSDETVYRIKANLEAVEYSGQIDAGLDEEQVTAEPDPAPALIIVTAPGGPTRIIQSPFGALPSAGGLSMGPIDYDARGSVIFSGGSEVDGIVRIYADDEIVGQRRVAANDRWYFIAAEALARGAYNIRAEIEKEDGSVERIIVPFERVDFEPQSDEGPALNVTYNAHHWQLSRPLHGGGRQVTAIFAPPLKVQPDN